MADLTNEQLKELQNFLVVYKSFNEKLNTLQHKINELSAESSEILKNIESVKADEKKWIIENAKQMNMTEKEFLKLCYSCRITN